MENKALTVPFHGNHLYIINQDGEPYTPMKPIVEGMGLDWRSQATKLRANKSRWGVVIITTPSSSGEQEMVCLPLRKLFGWMQGIHPNKVNPEIRDKVIQYQNECDEVLYQHWRARLAVPMHPHKPIQDEAWRIASGNTNIKAELYRRAKQHFGVARITEIPAEQCQAAVEYIRSLEGDYIGKPVIINDADPTRVAHAFALASEVASVASRTVFEAVMNHDVSLMCSRWLFCMNTNPQGQAAFHASLLDRNAVVATYAQLVDRIAAGDGMLLSNKELADLASVCSRKLAQRLEHSARR